MPRDIVVNLFFVEAIWQFSNLFSTLDISFIWPRKSNYHDSYLGVGVRYYNKKPGCITIVEKVHVLIQDGLII